MSADRPAEDAARSSTPSVMREVLGHFASGVTVVTALTADGPIGFTCQSFSSLSLDPPLVVFAPGADVAHLAAAARDRPVLRQRARRGPGRRLAELRPLRRRQVRRGARGRRARTAPRSWTASSPGSTASCGPSTTAATTRIVVARVLDLGADPDRRPLLFHRGSLRPAAAQRG